MILETLIGHHDVNEARETNKKQKENCLKVAKTYWKTKALTVIYHLNKFGCKIGKTALQKKKELQLIQHEKTLAARKKEEVAYLEKKRKYDAVMNLQITYNTKLTGVQLRLLLIMKKRKSDEPISSIKRVICSLYGKSGRIRQVEVPQYDHNNVKECPWSILWWCSHYYVWNDKQR